jgi:hypothetical protein
MLLELLTRNHFELFNWKNKFVSSDKPSSDFQIFWLLCFFNFPTNDWFNNNLKHLRRIRRCELIKTVWLWHHFHLVYWWWGLNPRPFDREPTRPQLSLIIGHWTDLAVSFVRQFF